MPHFDSPRRRNDLKAPRTRNNGPRTPKFSFGIAINVTLDGSITDCRIDFARLVNAVGASARGGFAFATAVLRHVAQVHLLN